MSICVALTTSTLYLAVNAFSLHWVHSVEKVEWQEDWYVESQNLVLETARIKGSGAGMEPADNAILKNGWWEWQPHLPPLKELVLANSNATVSNWQLCPKDQSCIDLNSTTDSIVITPCSIASNPSNVQ